MILLDFMVVVIYLNIYLIIKGLVSFYCVLEIMLSIEDIIIIKILLFLFLWK